MNEYFCPDMVHIGQKIKEIITKRGMTKTEMAKRLNMSSSNVHKIFLRKSIDAELLKRIGEKLEFDFFACYRLDNDKLTISQETETTSYFEKLKKKYEDKITTLNNEISYLKEINEMLREKIKSLSGK